MKGRKKVIAICCLFLAGLLGLCGCSSPSSDSAKDRISDELVYESSMELEYAKQFSVDYYKDGYRLLATSDGTKSHQKDGSPGTNDSNGKSTIS